MNLSVSASVLTLALVLAGCGDNEQPEPERTCNQEVCVSQPEYDCSANPPAMIIVVVRKEGVSEAPYVVEVFNPDGSRFGSAVPVLDDANPHATEVVFQEHPLIVFSSATDPKELVRYTFDPTKCETTTV